MNEQLVLAPTHRDDPQESAIAASRVNASHQYRLVLVCLANAERPLTDDEIAERCGLLRHAAGTRRGVAALGNPASTWRLTEKGRRWVLDELAGAA